MKKQLITLLLLISIQVWAEPLTLTDWKQPLINKSVKYVNYTSILNCEKKTPFYVFYNLYESDFEPDKTTRKDRWSSTVSEKIKLICGKNFATIKDYRKSGYDRGHLSPAADWKANQNKMNQTFSFANAAPQDHILNSQAWKYLEKNERQLAIEHQGITVITGVIQSKNKYIGRNVGVPDYFYKIILWKENGKVKYIAYLSLNDHNNPDIPQVDAKLIESKAGVDFGL